VGVLAFCIELAVDTVARARLRAMSWAIELTVAADGADADTDSHHLRGIGDLVPAWLVMMSSGAVLAFAASLLVVRVAPAATGAGVALVMANLNGRETTATPRSIHFE
jgi:H+/Cl- antiporter ClcA